MPIVKSFISEFRSAFSYEMKEPINYGRIMNVHPSQLPICPTQFIMNWIKNANKGYNTLDLRSKITLGIGTHVHESLQSFLAEVSPNLVGNWRCKKCYTEYKFCKKPSKCKCCDSTEFYYEELPISYKGFEGHIDTVYNIDDKYLIVDYKTTTADRLKAKSLNPGINYQVQLRSYALLLQLQYKVKVSKIMLLFIAKERPQSFATYTEDITQQKLKDIFNFLCYQRDLLKKLLTIKTYEEFLALEAEPCANEFCPACKDHKATLEFINNNWRADLFPIADRVKEMKNGNI